MNRRNALASLALLAAAPLAQAEILCVNTDAQLVAAFASAQSAGATEIRVRAGLYTLVSADPNTPSLSYSGQSDLTVTGGWTGPNNTCASRLPDADATVLSAASTGPLMRIYAFSQSNVVVELRGLSLRSGRTASSQFSACLTIESDVGSNAEFIIEQNTFRNCTHTGTVGANAGAIDMVLRDAAARLRSNVITGSFGAPGVASLSALGNSTYYFSNNTVTGNAAIPGRTGPFGVQLSGNTNDNAWWIQNNVLWGNGGTDLFINTNVQPAVTRNIIGTHTPLPGGSFDIANLYGVDPGFVGNGNLRPRADSPMRNSGSTVAGGLASTDAAGLPRWIGNSVDRGAYEYDELFGDSFDPLP